MGNGTEKEFSLYLITDTHYFETSLGASGPAYERRSITDQKCIAETGAIIDAGFEILSKDQEIDTVIIPGDLVYNGEKESHRSFIKKLEWLRASGKKIYVITARHDFDDSPVGYIGEETVPVEGTKREELYALYYDFGFSTAIAVDRQSLSYVAQLAPGIRLLCLNCDGDNKGFRGFDSRQMEWIRGQIIDAHSNGCYIFAMTHYPILPGSPVMNFIGDAKVTNWHETAQTLADSGLDLIFTGHMHMQSVNTMTSESGNTLYDVCTGSFVGCPCSIRKAVFKNDNSIEITSSTIDDFDWDKNGKTAREYFESRFDRMITDTIDAMAGDFEYFAGKISIDKNNKKLRLPVKLVGKILQKLTLGGLGRIMFFRVDKPIKHMLLKDFGIELVRNIFIGDEPYTKGTPQYEAVEKFLRRLRPVTKILEKKLGGETPELSDIPKFVLSLIGDEKKQDNNSILPIKWKNRVVEKFGLIQ